MFVQIRIDIVSVQISNELCSWKDFIIWHEPNTLTPMFRLISSDCAGIETCGSAVQWMICGSRLVGVFIMLQSMPISSNTLFVKLCKRSTLLYIIGPYHINFCVCRPSTVIRWTRCIYFLFQLVPKLHLCLNCATNVESFRDALKTERIFVSLWWKQRVKYWPSICIPRTTHVFMFSHKGIVYHCSQMQLSVRHLHHLTNSSSLRIHAFAFKVLVKTYVVLFIEPKRSYNLWI